MKIGIIGKGIVGGALYDWLTQKRKLECSVRDGPKEIHDDLYDTDCVFICLPAPTLESRRRDLTAIKEALFYLRKYNNPIFIRSTVNPGDCDRLAHDFDLKVFSVPEFLTMEKANYDLNTHEIVAGVKGNDDAKNLLIRIFKNRNIIILTNTEAEIAKMAHNGFCAMKVNYFNGIALLCKKLSADYRRVLFGVFVSGFIERSHTMVPGPDGFWGYGNKCLPKDVKAQIGIYQDNEIPVQSLKTLETENQYYREFSGTPPAA